MQRFTSGNPQQNWALFRVVFFTFTKSSHKLRNMFWKSYDFQAYFSQYICHEKRYHSCSGKSVHPLWVFGAIQFTHLEKPWTPQSSGPHVEDLCITPFGLIHPFSLEDPVTGHFLGQKKNWNLRGFSQCWNQALAVAGLAKVGPGLGDFRLSQLDRHQGINDVFFFKQKNNLFMRPAVISYKGGLDHHQKCLCQSCLDFVPKHQGRENYGVFPLKGKLLNVRALTLDGRTLNAPSWEWKRKNMHVKV